MEYLKMPRRIKELFLILVFTYMITMSVIEYVNTHDYTYLILPGVLAFTILVELATRFFGMDQRNGPKKK